MAEISKSGRARCRRCSEKIANKTLRLGTDWFLYTGCCLLSTNACMLSLF
jgi:hypothetical protein